MNNQVLFLPGASGDTSYWQNVANQVAPNAEKLHVGWPGFGNTPADPAVTCFDDLVSIVVRKINRQTTLIAQSMGCVVAMRATLERSELVTHLVLCVVAGGINLDDLNVRDWRSDVLAQDYSCHHWFAAYNKDMSEEIATISARTLVISGDADPTSPVALGQRIASLIPNSKHHVIRGGEHNLARSRASEIAPLIERHLFSF